MNWQTAHPLVIDPTEKRPTLIGSEWARRKPEGDDWDRCRIVGVFDTGNDANGLELCVQPIAFGQPVMTADAEDFASAYRREEADDPAERVSERLREIEATAT